MPSQLRFISLFVDDLVRARKSYSAVFGLQPLGAEAAAEAAPSDHPFSPLPPAVFDLGGVHLALYQVDGRVTHTGDVGLGVAMEESTETVAERVGAAGGQLLRSPDGPPPGADPLLVFMLPDRHFFEVPRARG